MRYGEFVLKSTRLDRLIMEQNQYRQLLNDLSNHWMTYASHRETGIVYDIDIIKGKIEELSKQIAILEQELEDS